ncbi:murein biosynthesis integral membrane protein MurJ [Opitutus sp. ER46]|uniref:murein biosynthesis integral membrane protein MurJ n=1 Tax=Opitutus sp. ER46 TaxID=2161864 RepID=UPI000D3237A9|nr:murein biosynthesis integral membrane protein MurJ [Opitutus sp. ER46]PTX90773.1 murein biosynthesis integral membrane protein MurJ [Opitutus sp. ER46]
MSKNLKNIGLVSGLTLTSRVLGLVRESVTAAFFGTSALMSAFVTGLQLPNLFRRLLAEGGLTAAFVPTLNEQLERRQREGAFELVNKVSSWLLLVTSGVVAVAMLVFSQDSLIRSVGQTLGAGPDAVDRWVDAAHFTVILFPYLLFVSLAAAFSAALQSLHRFLEPALSPIWLNLSIIGLLAGSAYVARGHPEDQILWLTAGWLIGGFLQMLVPALALRREGWRPQLDLGVNEPLRAMVRLMVPTLFSSSIYLVNMTASRYIGLSLNDQAVAVLNYAQRIMELPIGVFAVAVATVVFPLISRFAAAGDHANLAASYRKGMRLILLINIPAAVGLGILATPIIRVILQHGEFGHGDTDLMTPVLIANALGLPFLSFASLALRAFYAQRDTVIPVHAALLSFSVNIVLSLALMRPYSIVGLAIASSAAAAVQAIYLQWHLARKQDGLAFHHLAGDLWKIVFAAAVMGVVVWAGWWARGVFLPASRTLDVGGMAVVIAVGILVYGGLAWLLRVEAREDVDALLGRFRRKFGRG